MRSDDDLLAEVEVRLPDVAQQSNGSRRIRQSPATAHPQIDQKSI
jgi:hypothetical protein